MDLLPEPNVGIANRSIHLLGKIQRQRKDADHLLDVSEILQPPLGSSRGELEFDEFGE